MRQPPDMSLVAWSRLSNVARFGLRKFTPLHELPARSVGVFGSNVLNIISSERPTTGLCHCAGGSLEPSASFPC